MSKKPVSQNGHEWWRGAAIYQVYPRSFLDANGDGVGDLRGIISRLDYVAALGVDGIWISPFFKSPMKDFGYDVSDYQDVDPLFGTLADCEELIAGAHRRGLKVIFDLVISHTSDQHAWFQESRSSRGNPKADWYVWADPKKDGSPPNNWQSFFGGPSWSYEVRRGQYYMHNFLSSQPDLNFHNPEVQEAALATFRFWLERGVDGFRLDVANCYMHDLLLRDNPPAENPEPQFFNIAFPTPFTCQDHVYDFSRPENIAFIERIRKVLDQYDDRMALAEIAFNKDALGMAAAYTANGKRLHTAYNFSLISGDRASASYIRQAVESFEKAAAGGSWPAWAFSNHDVVRVASRWGGQHADDPRFHKMLFALLCSLRGTAFIYQGEELGLPDAPIPPEKIQDPWGKYLYPLWQGRDGCRTPMPWNVGMDAGFTKAKEAWLPVPESHRALCVARQEDDPASVLSFARRFLKWRKTQRTMVTGIIGFIDAGRDDVLLFERQHGSDPPILCAFNFSPEQIAVQAGSRKITLEGFEARFGGDAILLTSAA